jgi:hypothetical protein
MRSIFLKTIEQARYVPILFELRELNSDDTMSDTTLLDAIYRRVNNLGFSMDQEYFAAVYLSQADDKLSRRVLERLMFQQWWWYESDMLMEMLFAINPEALERNWLLPKLQELKGMTAGDTAEARCIAYIRSRKTRDVLLSFLAEHLDEYERARAVIPTIEQNQGNQFSIIGFSSRNVVDDRW